MKKYQTIILLGVITLIVAPSIASAAWWNPFSWFPKKQSVTTVQEIPNITLPELPDIALPKNIPVPASKPTKKASPETQKALVPSPKPIISTTITPPMSWELEEFAWLCKQNSSACTPEVKESFTTSPAFRYLTLDAISRTKNSLLDQQLQQKIKQPDCLSVMTPENERTFSPQQQNSVRKARCGTSVTQSDLNYKLYQQQRYTECLIANKPYTSCEIYKPSFN